MCAVRTCAKSYKDITHIMICMYVAYIRTYMHTYIKSQFVTNRLPMRISVDFWGTHVQVYEVLPHQTLEVASLTPHALPSPSSISS
jgi:hypothetical protein